jgi:hypothetical protein
MPLSNGNVRQSRSDPVAMPRSARANFLALVNEPIWTHHKQTFTDLGVRKHGNHRSIGRRF